MPTEERFRHAQAGVLPAPSSVEIVRFVMNGGQSSQIVERFIVSFVFHRLLEIKP
jgi:hypothetical protein